MIDANSKGKTFTLIFETCSTSTTLQFYDLLLAESFVASPPEPPLVTAYRMMYKQVIEAWLVLGQRLRADGAVENSPYWKADVL